MSSSQLDDLNEEEGNKSIAKALGINVDELEELDYGTIQSNESNDGLVYYYYIEIQKKSSSEEVLNKVMKNTNCDSNNEFVTAYLELENFPDDDENGRDETTNEIIPNKPMRNKDPF